MLHHGAGSTRLRRFGWCSMDVNIAEVRSVDEHGVGSHTEERRDVRSRVSVVKQVQGEVDLLASDQAEIVEAHGVAAISSARRPEHLSAPPAQRRSA